MSTEKSRKNVKNSIAEQAPVRKQQARSLETRRRLLDAARAIFVRDGYERAQIDAIAAAAGRTKGAIYGHFKDKEDLFLALLEERARKDMEAVAARMRPDTDQAANLAILRNFYRNQAADKSWAILTLEFKLYALRYPEAKRRLRQTYRLTRPKDLETRVREVFGAETTDSRLTMEGSVAVLNPIVCGLVLESLLEPEHFPASRLPAYLEALFDGLIQPAKSQRVKPSKSNQPHKPATKS